MDRFNDLEGSEHEALGPELPELSAVTLSGSGCLYVTTGLPSAQGRRQLHTLSVDSLFRLLVLEPPIRDMWVLDFEVGPVENWYGVGDARDVGAKVTARRVSSIDRHYVSERPQSIYLMLNFTDGDRMCVPPLPEGLPHEQIYWLAKLCLEPHDLLPRVTPSR